MVAEVARREQFVGLLIVEDRERNRAHRRFQRLFRLGGLAVPAGEPVDAEEEIGILGLSRPLTRMLERSSREVFDSGAKSPFGDAQPLLRGQLYFVFAVEEATEALCRGFGIDDESRLEVLVGGRPDHLIERASREEFPRDLGHLVFEGNDGHRYVTGGCELVVALQHLRNGTGAQHGFSPYEVPHRSDKGFVNRSTLNQQLEECILGAIHQHLVLDRFGACEPGSPEFVELVEQDRDFIADLASAFIEGQDAHLTTAFLEYLGLLLPAGEVRASLAPCGSDSTLGLAGDLARSHDAVRPTRSNHSKTLLFAARQRGAQTLIGHSDQSPEVYALKPADSQCPEGPMPSGSMSNHGLG